MDQNLYERYQRQMILKNFGEAAQDKLLHASVLVIGAGGLGCPALQYLAAAGVGTIGIVDHDVVSLSNLHRQVLYTTEDIGFPKAKIAAGKLNLLNPGIKIIFHQEKLTNQNALSLIEPFDIIIDGTDNFSSRYMINDACVILNKPLVYGAVSQYEGQVTVFNCKDVPEKPVNYRDLFPQPPGDDEVLNCSQAGVLGVLPGIIGAMQANETIKIITGIGKPLINRLLTYNALNNYSYEIKLVAREDTRSLIPAGKADFEKMNYEMFCSTSFNEFEIDNNFFNDLLLKGNIDVVDVREVNEHPVITGLAFKKIPLSELATQTTQLNSDTIVTICQTGKRSQEAAQQLASVFGKSKNIFSLRGGIVQWQQNNAAQLL